MNDKKPPHTGMDFPHDLPRPGKRAAHTDARPPKMTKQDLKRMAMIRRKSVEGDAP